MACACLINHHTKLKLSILCDVVPLGLAKCQCNREVFKFLGGLSLHLNHLIASHTANYDWPFGTLPFGLFRSFWTYSGHF